MSKDCIIIGGGTSVRGGIESGLWDKIKGKDIWSLNYAYKLLPYLPSRQCFVDYQFFHNNENDLHDMAAKGVPIHSKSNSKLRHIEETFIKTYNTVRQKGGFRGRTALKVPPEAHLFTGRMGLVGAFALALSIAEGYENLYLLGYDFGSTGMEDKDTHWYQNQVNVKSTGVGRPTVYWNKLGLKKEVEDFQVFTTVEGLKIYNVSPNSNIPYFEKIDYPKFYELIGGQDVNISNQS